MYVQEQGHGLYCEARVPPFQHTTHLKKTQIWLSYVRF